ncbi:AcrR family transcriptional regulator [Mycolicibacterium iranicum]|uniref:AcrR family transcriptional regulator n=1 Tax=Mycolicibacterium iranicum TaxID=912594 RepID=A0A839QE27_MYCIR|nr:TetR/AcrR family transcriptional regulator [Mycolicibacterium iranicum]MBB2992436.1 AcrR family transcriptional regulator [Mycolicibacterium iranicum]
MTRNDWLVGDRRAEAAERIYAAAIDLIVRDGLDAFDIAALQAVVHCSRATIYRHAGGKNQIRDTVLMREAERIVATVRTAVAGLTGAERATTAVIVALERIRADPMGRVLLNSLRGGELTGIVRSQIPAALAAELTGATDDPQAAQWTVRVVLALLFWPVEDPVVEREMLQRFLTSGA